MVFTAVGSGHVLVQCFHSLDHDRDVEVQGGPRGGGFAEALAVQETIEAMLAGK